MIERINMTGQRFGRLTVIRFSHHVNRKSYYWLCRCDCGTETVTQRGRLIRGTTRSCGCLAFEQTASGVNSTTHGMSHLPEYRIWVQMRYRCGNPSSPDYSQYGGRGIRICDRWQSSFVNFYTDMGQRPSPQHTIDRKDNDGNYEPSNCRWATSEQQSENKRNTRIVTAFGEARPLSQWAKRFGLDRHVLWERLNRGWSTETAIAQPLLPRGTKLGGNPGDVVEPEPADEPGDRWDGLSRK